VQDGIGHLDVQVLSEVLLGLDSLFQREATDDMELVEVDRVFMFDLVDMED